MTVGDCENAFQLAAAEDGLTLQRSRVEMINQRGHLGLPEGLGPERDRLGRIFRALGGIESEQTAKSMTPLRGDFVHQPTGLMIEVDESQHFTSARLLTLDMYPTSMPLGFDVNHYRALCRQWAPVSDRFRRDKAAVGFGPAGRQRQRAYHDALRDIAAPALGHPAVIRVDACDRDGAAAYARARERIRAELAAWS